MIDIKTNKLSDVMGTQVLWVNKVTEKTLHLICPIDQDLQKFIELNTPIAEIETASDDRK